MARFCELDDKLGRITNERDALIINLLKDIRIPKQERFGSKSVICGSKCRVDEKMDLLDGSYILYVALRDLHVLDVPVKIVEWLMTLVSDKTIDFKLRIELAGFIKYVNKGIELAEDIVDCAKTRLHYEDDRLFTENDLYRFLDPAEFRSFICAGCVFGDEAWYNKFRKYKLFITLCYELLYELELMTDALTRYWQVLERKGVVIDSKINMPIRRTLRVTDRELYILLRDVCSRFLLYLKTSERDYGVTHEC